MCTSLTLKTTDGNHLLARTMDFAFQLGTDVVLYPRQYSWKSEADGRMHKTKYAFIGMGRNLGNVLFADGVNEKGCRVRRCIFRALRDTRKRNGRAPVTSLLMSLSPGPYQTVTLLKT